MRRPGLRRSLRHFSATRAEHVAEGNSLPPALLVAATKSGAGKTVTTLALLAALKRRGFTVQAAKAGPDFIDCAYHARVTGRSTPNLDTWMGGEASLRPLLTRACAAEPKADAVIVEGVMGLFDGAEDGSGSSADIARVLDIPVLLLADVRGTAQSAAAVVEGFMQHRPGGRSALNFAGCICTHVGSERHEAMLRRAFEDARLPLLGFLPRRGAPHFESRHLGLVTAEEADLSDTGLAEAADWLEAHVDIDALLNRMGLPKSKTRKAPPAVSAQADADATGSDSASAADSASSQARCTKSAHRQYSAARPRIAVARDEAFLFCYADVPAVLGRFGAEIVYFSPLHDTSLPPRCTAVYLPGGYPELHAARLAANTSMKAAMHAAAKDGVRIYGECGGYIWLSQSITLPDGTVHPMCGLLPAEMIMQERFAALGYRSVAWHDDEAGSAAAPDAWRGHEFHYARQLDAACPPDCTPLWQLCDRRGASLPAGGAMRGSVCGSWVHLYPAGSTDFWRMLALGDSRRMLP